MGLKSPKISRLFVQTKAEAEKKHASKSGFQAHNPRLLI
jgi:hypothetical protein